MKRSVEILSMVAAGALLAAGAEGCDSKADQAGEGQSDPTATDESKKDAQSPAWNKATGSLNQEPPSPEPGDGPYGIYTYDGNLLLGWLGVHRETHNGNEFVEEWWVHNGSTLPLTFRLTRVPSGAPTAVLRRIGEGCQAGTAGTQCRDTNAQARYDAWKDYASFTAGSQVTADKYPAITIGAGVSP